MGPTCGWDKGDKTRRVLVGKPLGECSVGIPRRRYGNNITMDLRKMICCEDQSWM